LQIMMMWVVLQGVGAADTVWQTAVTTVDKQGYSIVHASSSNKASSKAQPWYYEAIENSLWINTGAGVGIGGGSEAGTNAEKTAAIIKHWGVKASPWNASLLIEANLLAQHILQAQYCMHSSYQTAKNLTHISQDNISASLVSTAAKVTYHFPFYTSATKTDPNGCGSLSYDTPKAHPSKTNSGYYTTTELAKAVPVIVGALSVAAKEAVYNCAGVNDSGGSAIRKCVPGNPLTVASDAFIQTLSVARVKFIAANPAIKKGALLKTAAKKGWAVAGAYYKYVAMSNNTVSNMLKVRKFVKFHIPGGASYYNSDDVVNATYSLFPGLTAKSASTGGIDVLWSDFAALGGGFRGVTSAMWEDVGNIVTAMFIEMVTGHTPQQVESGILFTNSKDPISSVQSFGWHLVTFINAMFAILLIYATFILAVAILPPSLLFAVLFAVVFKVLSLLFMALGAMYIMGLMMYVYIPLIPYFIFFFAVLGWLIAVVETMLAAPLVAIGIAYPEGHQMLGRADPAVMLVTNVFIRPTLMVFGFIAGTILSYVAVTLLNETFEFVMLTNTGQPVSAASATYVHTSQYGGLGNVLRLSAGRTPAVLIAFLVIYIGAVMVVLNKCFALIHILPDSVLRWIGGQHQFGEYSKGESEVAGQAKSGIGEAGHITKAGSSIAADAAKGSAAGGGSFSSDDGDADKAGGNIDAASSDKGDVS